MSQIFTNHGNVGSETENRLASNERDSRYCYLLRELADAESQRPAEDRAKYFDDLKKLATVIHIESSSGQTNSNLPAIYTYFGQFVNHDLSAPTATPRYLASVAEKAKKLDVPSEAVLGGPDAVALMSSERPDSPQWLIDNIRNQHPKPLCLYSLYGSGPASPNKEIRELYDQDTMKFRLGRTFDDPAHPQTEPGDVRDDLVREKNIASIADRRNDENVVIGQLHLAFMLFHNKTIEVLKARFSKKNELFKEARALVTRHFQYCVLHDFLKKIVPDETAGSQLIFRDPGAVPFEFTTAAFRFGHSMIAQNYDYNRFFGVGGLEGRLATLVDLFLFTSRGRMGSTAAVVPGNGALPTHWVIDWERFLQVNPGHGSAAELIDVNLAVSLYTLGDVATVPKMDEGLSSIVHRNLKRGYHRFMPSGQDIAAAVGARVLEPDQIKSAFTHREAPTAFAGTGFAERTPLWVYFLCEAKVAGGNTLGPAAGAIVRGTITQLLRHNPDSATRYNGGNWKPENSPLKLENDGAVKDIKSFLQFAGVL